jgi:hypothetical protein
MYSQTGAVNGFYRCNEYRVEELNSRIFSRNLPSEVLQMSFDPRPEKTRQVLFPTINCHHSTNNEPILKQPIYNIHQEFNPGSKAPFSGYASQIDTESNLKDIFMTKQKWCSQSEYIPSSKSDLYKTNIPRTGKLPKNHELLFKQEQFNKFNPNPCNLGRNIFNNSTRDQIKDLRI